jgi:hypothetical protein
MLKHYPIAPSPFAIENNVGGQNSSAADGLLLEYIHEIASVER